MSQDHQAESGALLRFSHESSILQPGQGGPGCSSAPFGDQGAHSASQGTGKDSATIPCTQGHWQCLTRKALCDCGQTPALSEPQSPRFLRELCCCSLLTSVVSDPVRPCGPQPSRLLCPWDSPGKSTGVGCHALLQGIFPTQGSNLCLLHGRQILYH